MADGNCGQGPESSGQWAVGELRESHNCGRPQALGSEQWAVSDGQNVVGSRPWVVMVDSDNRQWVVSNRQQAVCGGQWETGSG